MQLVLSSSLTSPEPRRVLVLDEGGHTHRVGHHLPVELVAHPGRYQAHDVEPGRVSGPGDAPGRPRAAAITRAGAGLPAGRLAAGRNQVRHLHLAGAQLVPAQRRLPVQSGGLPHRAVLGEQPLGERSSGMREPPDDPGPPGSQLLTLLGLADRARAVVSRSRERKSYSSRSRRCAGVRAPPRAGPAAPR